MVLRQVDEYSYECLPKNLLYRVCRGNKKTKWVASHFLSGIFLAKDSKFKQKINNKLQKKSLILNS